MYESPIKLIMNETTRRLGVECENAVIKAALEMGIDIDGEELLKALQYDRGQYMKGYNDAILVVISEITLWATATDNCGKDMSELVSRIKGLMWEL